MVKLFVLLAASVASVGFAQRQAFSPRLGDTVEIERHYYKGLLSDTSQNTLLQQFPSALSRDRLRRSTILALNQSNREIVAVHFSDAFNAGSVPAIPAFPVLPNSIPTTSFDSFRLFFVGNKGVRVRAGQDLILSTLQVFATSDQRLRQALCQPTRESWAMNNYVCDNFQPGKYLVVSCGTADPASDVVFPALQNQFQMAWVAPQVINRYRIIAVIQEPR